MNFSEYLEETTKENAFKAIFDKSHDGKEKLRDLWRYFINPANPSAETVEVVHKRLKKLGFTDEEINLIGLRAKSIMKKVLLSMGYDEEDIIERPRKFFKYWTKNSAFDMSTSDIEEIQKRIEKEFRKVVGL